MAFEQENKKRESNGFHPFMFLRNKWIWLVIICLIAGGVYWHFLHRSGVNDTSAPAKQGRGGHMMGDSPVVTAIAKTADINVYLNGLGAVTAINTVTIHTRVDGQLMKVLFKEGQVVNKGDLLAQIDPGPFQAQLTQVEGQLAKDQALLDNAKLDLQRYKTLSSEDSIAEQQVDTQQSLVHQYEGQVKNDQGQVENAKLQLGYTQITAPISGRLGLRSVDEGNIVHAGDANGLAVITQLQPITVIFSIPEDNLPQVSEELKQGKHLTADAFNREDTKKLATGELLALDNQIDPTTGTVRIKAVFPNEDNELFSNQFVNIHLLVNVKQGAIVVPTAAIQQGPQGNYVYIVKDDKTVEMRPVTIGSAQGDDISIEEGVALGEVVVVEGADKLRDGSKVQLPGQGGDASSTAGAEKKHHHKWKKDSGDNQ